MGGGGIVRIADTVAIRYLAVSMDSPERYEQNALFGIPSTSLLVLFSSTSATLHTRQTLSIAETEQCGGRAYTLWGSTEKKALIGREKANNRIPVSCGEYCRLGKTRRVRYINR